MARTRSLEEQLAEHCARRARVLEAKKEGISLQELARRNRVPAARRVRKLPAGDLYEHLVEATRRWLQMRGGVASRPAVEKWAKALLQYPAEFWSGDGQRYKRLYSYIAAVGSRATALGRPFNTVEFEDWLLSDGAIRKRLSGGLIPHAMIPKSMVMAQRELLKVKRLLKEKQR